MLVANRFVQVGKDAWVDIARIVAVVRPQEAMVVILPDERSCVVEAEYEAGLITIIQSEKVRL